MRRPGNRSEPRPGRRLHQSPARTGRGQGPRRRTPTRDDQRSPPRSRLVPVRLDLTDRESIVDAARQASDVTLVVNNAGIFTGTSVLGDEAALRQELEVNYLGPVAVTRAFASVLVDEPARYVRAALSGPLKDLYPSLA